MFRSHRRLHGVLFVLGLVMAAFLIAPAYVGGATTYTRSASCAGLDFYPTDSHTEYNNVSTLRVHRYDRLASPYGTGVFRCDPGLPNGAVVKKVQFTALVDADEGIEGVDQCALRRSGLTAANAETGQDLGRVDFVDEPGGVSRLTDSSIENATIDNANWGYWLECLLPYGWAWADTQLAGLYGADVIYTITAAKG